uniref:Uncharacterized protein n=1 Tax=Picea glauca TaxID=3330 RepID=A0A101M4N9_PICGL|nr:hypothetical protein ABT39_MTgene796 [Picea glauca]
MRERLTQNKSLVLNSHPVHITHITGNARTTQPTSYIYLKLPLPLVERLNAPQQTECCQPIHEARNTLSMGRQ